MSWTAKRQPRSTARKAVFTLSAPLPDGRSVPVAVRRADVRRINLRVHRDGTVHLSIPVRAGVAGIRQAEAFLKSHGTWIAEHLDRQVDWKHPSSLIKADADGQMTLPLWGKRADAAEVLGLTAPELRAALDTDRARLDRAVKDACIAHVRRALEHLEPEAERAVGRHATSWSVRWMTSRWGSCTPARGTIRIGAQLAAYPPCCLEATVHHELVHLIEANHGPRFHALLDATCPGNRVARSLLKLPPLKAGGVLDRDRAAGRG